MRLLIIDTWAKMPCDFIVLWYSNDAAQQNDLTLCLMCMGPWNNLTSRQFTAVVTNSLNPTKKLCSIEILRCLREQNNLSPSDKWKMPLPLGWNLYEIHNNWQIDAHHTRTQLEFWWNFFYDIWLSPIVTLNFARQKRNFRDYCRLSKTLKTPSTFRWPRNQSDKFFANEFSSSEISGNRSDLSSWNRTLCFSFVVIVF